MVMATELFLSKKRNQEEEAAAAVPHISIKCAYISPPLSRRLKRRLEELESTAESHPPMSTTKRAKIETEELTGPIKFLPDVMHKLFEELNRARCYMPPYHDRGLQWEDNALWELIRDAVKLPVQLSVRDFKLNLMGYYVDYENDNLLSYGISNNTLSLIKNVFMSRRESLADYLPATFRPPLHLALEQYHQGSGTTVSNSVSNSVMLQPLQSSVMLQPLQSSVMLQPLQSFPSSANSIYFTFSKGLKEIKEELSDLEYNWAQLHMTKNKGLMALFCDYDRKERIQLVQCGYGDYVMSSVQRVPQSPSQ